MNHVGFSFRKLIIAKKDDHVWNKRRDAKTRREEIKVNFLLCALAPTLLPITL
jgi:hypothetical protein